jgi:hypothetical protein
MMTHLIIPIHRPTTRTVPTTTTTTMTMTQTRQRNHHIHHIRQTILDVDTDDTEVDTNDEVPQEHHHLTMSQPPLGATTVMVITQQKHALAQNTFYQERSKKTL